MARAFLRKAKNHPAAFHLLGLCAARRGASAEAIQLLEQTVKLLPSYVDAQNNLGLMYSRVDRRADAERCFKRVIALSSTYAPAYASLGVIYIQERRLDEAVKMLEIATTLAPDQAMNFKNLGDALFLLGRESEAMTHHQIAVERWQGPVDAALFEHVWRFYSTGGDRARARATAAAWLAGDPESPVAKHCLAASSGQGVPDRASDGYVEQTFDAFAASFDEQLHAIGYRAHGLVNEALLRVVREPVAVALDGGCGTGLCGPYLRGLAGRVIGVDLSRKMLDRARDRGCYDELVTAELTAYLEAHAAEADVIVSADTLVYFGNLAPVSSAFAKALRPGGYLVVTLERSGEDSPFETFQLHPHGRYSHRPAYVESQLRAAGFEHILVEEAVVRVEKGVSVAGLVVTAKRP